METIKNILFPTDFSEASYKALSFAIEMAYHMKAQLSIFHAYRLPLVVEQDTGNLHPPAIDHEQIVDENFKKLEGTLSAQLQKIRYETITKPDPLPDAIEMVLETKNIDLIVMGTRGAEGLKELMAGTNTADVISKINIPVLAIPEETTGSKVEKIAFAYDYNGFPEANELDVLKDIVAAYDADLYVVHISESMEPEKMEDFKSLELVDKKFMEANRYYKIHLSGDVEEGIREFVANNLIDMLVVKPKDHGFFHKLFRKSITKKLTFHANVPLLILQH